MSEPQRTFEREVLTDPGDLQAAWEATAHHFIAWAPARGHDSYWLYHRDLFLDLLPPPGLADARPRVRRRAAVARPEGRRAHGRVLEPGGRLCLAIVHPFASAGMFESAEPDAPFVVEGTYLERRRYRDTVERDGFKVSVESEHRSIGWYFDALASAGFLVERLREVAIPESAVAAPRNRRWQRLPLFLHIRALRP